MKRNAIIKCLVLVVECVYMWLWIERLRIDRTVERVLVEIVGTLKCWMFKREQTGIEVRNNQASSHRQLTWMCEMTILPLLVSFLFFCRSGGSCVYFQATLDMRDTFSYIYSVSIFSR